MRTTREKFAALRSAEALGNVADSLEVRKGLMARVHCGAMTLVEAQLELDIIKRNGKFLGKMTRRQFFE